MTILKRILIALGSFWLAGVVAIIIMSDSGSMSNPIAVSGVPLMATVGVFVGPITFVADVHGLQVGYGGPPLLHAWAWILLAYLGYLGLFVGAVFPKRWQYRVACMVIEFVCALLAVKGVSYCI